MMGPEDYLAMIDEPDIDEVEDSTWVHTSDPPRSNGTFPSFVVPPLKKLM